MSHATTILRIELWHGILLIVLVLTLGQTRFVDPKALLLGGAFIGLNFFLLGFGILWVLTPLAGKGKVKAGIFLLVLKIIIFLGLLLILFFQYDIDGFSFALGFSTLIAAIFLEALMQWYKLE